MVLKYEWKLNMKIVKRFGEYRKYIYNIWVFWCF